MKNRYLATFLFFIISVSTVFAQESRRPTCGTTQYMEALIASDPSVADKLAELENATSELRARNISRNSSGQAIITIPTVVHVVYNGSAQNISDSRIFSQINVLNEDFGRMNADTVNTPAVFQHLGADTEIRFELAKRDPDGFATTGITRTQTSVFSFSTDNKVKYDATGGKNVWDRNQYLNIWVCNLSGLLLGYAQFPGLSAATDGVVIDYEYFGTFGASFPFNKGRTATHEIGHWLNLRHIWGDSFCGDDLVNDTPVQLEDNFGCPSFPHVSSCTGNPPNGDMFMNYMDYTDDRCMNIFTQGQKSRMNDAILIARLPLLTSPGLIPPSTGLEKIFTEESVNIFPNPAQSEVNIQLPLQIQSDINIRLSSMLGQTVIYKTFTTDANNEIQLNVSGLGVGLYLVEIETENVIVRKRITINR